jgi:hypothetical protein
MNRADFMKAHGYNHAEAYCLMKYATRDGHTVEWLWNSRDGVTPFIIRSKDGEEMNHVDFYLDRYLPLYKPMAGERVFVDMTPERARERAAQRVAFFWDHPETPMSAMFATKDEAIEAMYRDIYRPGAPDIVTADEWGI